MNTIPIAPQSAAANKPPSDTAHPNAAAATRSAANEPAAQQPFPLDAVAAQAQDEQRRLSAQQIQSANPITVVGDTIHIDETAMLYDTAYPVKLSDATYHIIFTSDGAIDIYEVF